MLCVLGDTPVMVWICIPVRSGSGKGELDKGGDRGCVLVCMYVCECMYDMVGDSDFCKLKLPCVFNQ